MKNQKEVWLPVKGYEGYYEVSNLGRVKSLKRIVEHNGSYSGVKTVNERLLKYSITKDGYKRVTLCKNSVLTPINIHQIVAMSFLGYERTGNKGLVVDHIDSCKSNNNLNNLRLISHRENCSKDKKNKSSKHTGVSWDKNRNNWRVTIEINKVHVFLGRFKNEKIAAAIYKSKLEEINKGQHAIYKLIK